MGMAATTANGSVVAASASMRSVGLLLVAKGDLRAGEEGSGPDLASSSTRQIYVEPSFAGTVE